MEDLGLFLRACPALEAFLFLPASGWGAKGASLNSWFISNELWYCLSLGSSWLSA